MFKICDRVCLDEINIPIYNRSLWNDNYLFISYVLNFEKATKNQS